MATFWTTHSGSVEPTTDETVVEWNVGAIAPSTLQRTLLWASFYGRVDGLAAPFGRALPGLVGFYQSHLDTSEVGPVSVHDADLDWVTWNVVNMDWRVAETESGTFSVFYNGWCAVDVKSQRTNLVNDPYAAIAIHTFVSGGGPSDLSQPTYSCSWAVRQLWTHH